jgi:drug/metabolite transporter (DMT)-like permease
MSMETRRDAALLLALSVVWGSGFAVVKIGQQYFPSVLYAALAFDVTAIGLFTYVVLKRDQWRPRRRRSWLAAGAIGLFTVTIYNVFFFIGQRGAPSAVGAMILSFIPLITALFAQALVPDEEFGVVETAGILVGLVGVGIIVRPDPAALAAGDVSRLLILVAATSNALGGVLVQRFEPPAPTPVLLAWAVPLGGVGLHLVSAFVVRESYGSIELAIPGLAAVAYLAVVVNVTGYIIFFTVLRRVGAFEVSLINYLQPFSAAVIGWLLLREQLEPLTVLGFCVIVVGFSLIKRDQLTTYVSRTGAATGGDRGDD